MDWSKLDAGLIAALDPAVEGGAAGEGPAEGGAAGEGPAEGGAQGEAGGRAQGEGGGRAPGRAEGGAAGRRRRAGRAELGGELGGRAGRAGRGQRTLSVFVHVDPSAADADSDGCDRLGVGGPAAGQAVRTATLSPAEVAELSDLPWVTRLTLAGRLRLLDDDPA